MQVFLNNCLTYTQNEYIIKSKVTQYVYIMRGEIMKTLYPNIEAERVRLQLTQEELSEQLGVERKTYYSWLAKGHIPTSKLIKMGEMFGCSIDYLVGRTRNPKLAV